MVDKKKFLERVDALRGDLTTVVMEAHESPAVAGLACALLIAELSTISSRPDDFLLGAIRALSDFASGLGESE